MRFILTIPIFLISFYSFSQKVIVEDIYEKRSTNTEYENHKCDIMLKIEGEELKDYTFVLNSGQSKIIDDQNNDLDRSGFTFMGGKLGIDSIKSNIAFLEIHLNVPSRKSAAIKELTGELKLYNPKESNGSLTKVVDYTSKTNINLLPSSLPIQVAYITPESLEKFEKERKAKSKADNKKKPEKALTFADELHEAYYDITNIDTLNQLVFLISGDRTKFVDIIFLDEHNNRIFSSGMLNTNHLSSYEFKEKPKPIWKLLICVETEGSVKKVPYSFFDIKLP